MFGCLFALLLCQLFCFSSLPQVWHLKHPNLLAIEMWSPLVLLLLSSTTAVSMLTPDETPDWSKIDIYIVPVYAKS